MSDGRSEDHDRPEGRKAPAASDLLAMWVTGSTSGSQAEPTDEVVPADDAVTAPEQPAEQAAPPSEPVEPAQEEYAESLWPSDESYAGTGAPEDSGSERWWPYAADTPSATEPVSSPDEPPASLDARSQDMSTTARWTLDDFERYVRHQEDNELADWIGGRGSPTAPEPTAAPPDQAPDEAPAGPTTEPTAAVEAGPVAPVPAPSPAPSAVRGPSAVPPPEPVAPVTPLPQDDEQDTGVVLDESDVEWNPPEGEAPVVAEPTAAVEPDDGTGAEPWSSWDLDAVREPDADAAPVQPVTEPDPAQEVLFSSDAPSAATGSVVPTEPDPEPVTLVEEPAPVDDVWPDAPTPAAEPDPEPDPAPVAEATDVTAPAEPEPSRWDLQEWYDDHGLRWVSGDGGYTWYSDDGQGWDAEHSLVIPVAPGFDPFPGDPRSPRAGVAAPEETPAPVAAPEPLLAPTPDPEPAPAAEPEDPDAWASTPADTSSFYAALAPQDDPPAEAATAAPAEPAPARAAEPWPGETTEPAAAPAAAEAAPTYTPATASEESFPEHVEYKPRGAHRSVLILFFVVAAVIAVGAIFWAVSRGNQVVWGIAAGITGFTLFFWWGLLNWTPTLVSVDGPMLEVSRGSDGERFDLRSPKLDIRVDDDVYSRNWRTTIVRPNGTELVIASSAVDAEEFSRIVAHYRAEVSR